MNFIKLTEIYTSIKDNQQVELTRPMWLNAVSLGRMHRESEGDRTSIYEATGGWLGWVTETPETIIEDIESDG